MTMTELAQIGYENYYQMLSDPVRMQAYKKAIFQIIKPGDIVIDLGTGTGILGLWAIQAGAARVYAIEKTNAIELAKSIAQANHCQDKMVFMQKNSLQVSLPEKADVLISETLGSFAIDENTLLFTNDARKRLLKENGKILPQGFDIFACPVESKQAYEKIDFWRHIEGLDFSPAFDLFSGKIMIEQINKQCLLSEAKKIASFDLMQDNNPDFHSRHYFPIKKAGKIHGIAGWFTVYLSDNITIDTAPGKAITHWKQAFFPFRESIDVIKNDVLDWSVKISGTQPDSDDCKIHYQYRCTQLKNETQSPNKKTGRNDPCPCGSGKKYKKCCLAV